MEKVLEIFAAKFEITELDLDDDLREQHEFDSIDAIELLTSLEDYLKCRLTQEEKKRAMEVTTARQIVDYVEALVRDRSL